MATYDELTTASQNADLVRRIRVACIVAAETIRTEAGATPNNANRRLWAKAVFNDPVAAAVPMLWACLAQNRLATLAAITGATDAALLTAVQNAIDVVATGA